MTSLGVPWIDDVIVRPHHKGFPPCTFGRGIYELRGQLALIDGGFVTPVLLLMDKALRRNTVAMQQFCDQGELSLSPHVKTTMSPEIILRQLRCGAWAVTVATCSQATAVRYGLNVDRILIANELVDPSGIQWLGLEMDSDEGFTGYCYVDSAAGVKALDEALSERGQRRLVPVLVEYGMPAGRSGLRSREEAVELAAMVRISAHLRLAGVAGFEGIIDTGFDPCRLGAVVEYVRDLRAVADQVWNLCGHECEDFLVTAGGSCYFELVRDEFDPQWRAGRPIRVVLRSGCYVAHDSGALEQHRTLMAQYCEPLALEPALELWARVLSRPEPDLAILDFGKRDVGIDAGVPVPQYLLHSGSKLVECWPSATVFAVNDQHAYLRLAPAYEQGVADPNVGDLIGLGISHPCTTLDKWRLIPVVDDDRTLISAARTWF